MSIWAKKLISLLLLLGHPLIDCPLDFTFPNLWNEIHVVTQLYVDKSADRLQELVKAIRNNLSNPYISNVHLLIDKELPSHESRLIQNCVESNNPKLKITHDFQLQRSRLLFSEAVAYALNSLFGKIVIICNADIYFDASISHLIYNPLAIHDFVNRNTSYFLSRYEHRDYPPKPLEIVDAKEFIDPRLFLTQCGPNYIDSHDSFIFLPDDKYLFLLEEAAFELGTWGIENRIIYELHQRGTDAVF